MLCSHKARVLLVSWYGAQGISKKYLNDFYNSLFAGSTLRGSDHTSSL
jgi:hypothetical protein